MPQSPEGPTRTKSSGEKSKPTRQTPWFLDEEMLKKSPSEIWDHWKDIPNRKPQDYKYAVEVGQYLGIPDDEINKVVSDVLGKAIQANDHSFAYEIMKKMQRGTDEERRGMAALAYEDHMRAKSPQGATFYAKEAWGEQSPQYIAATGPAQKQVEKRKKEQEKSPALLPLRRGATFADFYKAWYKMVDKVGSGIDIDLEAEMKSIIGESATKEIMDFLNNDSTSLESKDVLEFFQQHGSNEEQIGEVLGINFRDRKSKKKK